MIIFQWSFVLYVRNKFIKHIFCIFLRILLLKYKKKTRWPIRNSFKCTCQTPTLKQCCDSIGSMRGGVGVMFIVFSHKMVRIGMMLNQDQLHEQRYWSVHQFALYNFDRYWKYDVTLCMLAYVKHEIIVCKTIFKLERPMRIFF